MQADTPTQPKEMLLLPRREEGQTAAAGGVHLGGLSGVGAWAGV
jgi:hypothetical protein